VSGLSLAERLGYGPDERVLIVNCDDLGSSHAANIGIEDAIRHSFATSATVMVPCPWAYEAAQRCRELDVGVHLTLTAEYPGYRWRSLTGARSLHNKEGFMPATTREVYANADVEEARAECRAQIAQALAWGVDVTHLDSHMGSVQTDPRFYAITLTSRRSSACRSGWPASRANARWASPVASERPTAAYSIQTTSSRRPGLSLLGRSSSGCFRTSGPALARSICIRCSMAPSFAPTTRRTATSAPATMRTSGTLSARWSKTPA